MESRDQTPARGVPRPRDHGLADGREPGAGRASRCRLDAHRREGRALGGRARRGGGGHARAEAAEGAGAVITMVVDAPEVEAVLFGRRRRRRGPRPGALCVDMSTIAPSAALAGSASGCASAGSPSSTRPSRARAEGRGGHAHDHGRRRGGGLRARPAAARGDGRAVVHVGPPGHGAMIKVINNTVTAINAAALAEALAMVGKAGVDAEAFLEVAGSGSSASTMLELKAEADARAATSSRSSSSSTC